MSFELNPGQFKARETLNSDATHCCIDGGARSGKTVLFLRQTLVRALKAPKTRHAIFRYRFNAVKTAIGMQSMPKVMDMCFPGLQKASPLNREDWVYTLPNKSEIWLGGLDDKERTEKILGQEFSTIYLNECSQIPWHSRVTAITRLAEKSSLKLKAYYDLNPDSTRSWVYRTFVQKLNHETGRALKFPLDYAYYKINPEDNRENLPESYLRELDALPEAARKRFLLGVYADATEGSLWTEEVLASIRLLGHEGSLPEWLRVVVAVDPSGTRGDETTRSDAVGIVVVALGSDGHGYVLEDLTLNARPEDWSRIVVDAYHRHRADRVVGEANFGGDMVRAVIHAADNTIPYQSVTATRGKVVRAEPVSLLYDQGKVHHVGYFQDLEDELLSFSTSGYTGLRSPNRADALIWGIMDIFPDLAKPKDKLWVPPVVNTRAHRASAYARRR